MRYDIPDHPYIRWCEKMGCVDYGDFEQKEGFYCDECGMLIYGEKYNDDSHENLCEFCFNRIHREEDG